MGLAATAALLLALGAAPLGPPDHVGYAVRYAPHVMARVARNRDIPAEPHMVAYTYATDSDMGRLRLRIAGPAGTIEVLTVDLPKPGRDKRALIAWDVVVELGYPSRWICGPYWTGRARDCKVKVWVLR